MIHTENIENFNIKYGTSEKKKRGLLAYFPTTNKVSKTHQNVY